ncbi:flagellar hook-length control protein FliK [Thalassobaculum sp. OXR-137]|uniref:flagellar hook-length control protein FliK n=1 Tax=Thalassobaculum sp. OXR-137 TaxID=3100173 RepID=UPI002AC961B4|nr:flagellar hook-length control protein FliK [Thalassobaculum sp. OXR-137]WPZ34183.1 flagellar hook-length control protein FliK [Thalassobaculum sp. OXR-137]
MMAQIDENRTEHQVRERSASERPSRTDEAERDHRAERKDKTERKDKSDRREETAETEPTTSAKGTPGEQPVDSALLGLPELAAATAAPVTDGTEAVPAVSDGEAIAGDLDGTTGGQAAVPATGTSATEPAPAQAAAQQPQAGSAQPTDAKPAAAQIPVDDVTLAARQTAAQRDQVDPAAKSAAAQNSGDAVKAESASGRADSLMGAKVSIEAPVPVARSQGVSSAVLVQAQQAAASGPVQASNANGGAGTLHVGGNQPTFVGADANAANAAGGQGAAGKDAGAQNGGANAQGQNQGQGGHPNPQQVGISFGATIGQRGFGGEASRAQFQEILATRTARAQSASAAGGEMARPVGASSSSSSTPMTMAGVGGPQSTHTSASPVDRAAATAHGRPGANLGTPADQVAMKMSATAKDGGGKVTIRLTPEELGKVDIRIEISKEGLVRAVVAVERPETLELLQRDAKGLERVLQDAGLQTDGDSLEFDLRGDGGQYAGDTKEEAGNQGPAGGAVASHTSEGDAVADDQQGDGGSGSVKADGSLDLVA